MKKIISILLLLTLCFSFTACGKTEAKEISCDEIITAYENAGYTVEYHNHRDTDAESDVVCNIRIEDPKNPERNYLYIDRYSDESKSKAAAEDAKYNLVVWFVFAISGESRWLKSEYYGNIHYHSFNDEITKPLEGLMK